MMPPIKRSKNSFPGGDYLDVAAEYGTPELDNEHETMIAVDYGPTFFLKHFPESTSPFWNMKRNDLDDNIAEKVDLLLHGMETIGSAERSCDPKKMWESITQSGTERTMLTWGRPGQDSPFGKKGAGGVARTPSGTAGSTNKLSQDAAEFLH